MVACRACVVRGLIGRRLSGVRTTEYRMEKADDFAPTGAHLPHEGRLGVCRCRLWPDSGRGAHCPLARSNRDPNEQVKRAPTAEFYHRHVLSM